MSSRATTGSGTGSGWGAPDISDRLNGRHCPSLELDRRTVAQRPLLLQMEPNLRQLLRWQGFVEDPAPSVLAFGLAAAEAPPGRVVAAAGSGALAEIGRGAGPAIDCRIKPARSGLNSNVAMAAQLVVLAVDQACLVSAVPWPPGAAMPRISRRPPEVDTSGRLVIAARKPLDVSQDLLRVLPGAVGLE